MKLKAIRLKIFQPTANYRMPYDFDTRESYPLPPYSTVIGMIHKLCGFKGYHPMQISVSGSYASTTRNMFTSYQYGALPKNRVGVITVQGQHIGKGVSHVQLLIDVNLTIYIVPDEDSDFDLIYEALKYPKEYPNLGRHEDDAIFEAVDIVNLEQKELDEDMKVETGFYIPAWDVQKLDLLQENGMGLRGTSFKINKTYELVKQGKQMYRKWQRIPVIYASQFTALEGEDVLMDQNNQLVLLA